MAGLPTCGKNRAAPQSGPCNLCLDMLILSAIGIVFCSCRERQLHRSGHNAH